MDREVVKELIQEELNTKNLVDNLSKILEGEERARILNDYSQLYTQLGGSGASKNAAEIIFKTFL